LDKGALRRQNHSKRLQHPQQTDNKRAARKRLFFLFVPRPEAVGIAFARTLNLDLREKLPMKIHLTLKKNPSRNQARHPGEH
jgi:hypothetical protein